MKYRGSCHCGNVAFEVEGTLDGVLACNCSICARKGSLLWFLPREALRLLTPEENSAVYEFNRQVIRHRFCRTCGMHPYAEGVGRNGEPVAAINVRCLEGVDIDSLQVSRFDGKAL